MVGRNERRTPGVRHHVVSLLLFLVLLSGSITVIGFAQADDETFPGRPVSWEGFTLPERHVGDVWSYRLVEGSALVAPEAETYDRPEDVTIDLTWMEPAVSLDGDGRLRDVNVIAIHDSEYNATFMAHMDASTDLLVATGRSDEQQAPEGAFYLDVIRSNDASTHASYQPYRAAPSLPCLAAPYWEGALDSEASFTLPMCWPHGPLGLRPMTFAATAAYDVDGHRYVVFDRVNHEKSGIDRLVFRDDLPYPVEVVNGRHGLADASLDTVARYRLTSFQAGDELLAEGRPDLPVLPQLSMVPGTWTGVADDGIDHPFPWSDAFSAAIDHPKEDAVRAFLERHPDAVVERTFFFVGTDETDVTHQWSFQLAGHGEELGFCYVLRHDLREAPSPLLVELPQSPIVDVWCPPVRERERPVPEVEARSPTAKSLLAAWDVYKDGVGLPDDLPGYVIHRWHNSRYGIGFDAFERSQGEPLDASVQPENVTHRGHTVWFDEEGNVASVTVDGWKRDLSFEPGVTDPTTAVTSETPGADVAAWNFPTRSLVAAGSIVALLVALLYWASPFIKQVPLVGMFSRIQRDAALGAPARAAIMDAVASEPGIRDRELQRRVGMARGALQHHVRKLLEHDLVVRRRDGGFTRYWPPEAGVDGAIPLEGTPRTIRNMLRDEPTVSQTEIGRRLGISRQAVGKHLRRLRARGELPT